MRHIKWDDLRLFLAVSTEGGLSAAARAEGLCRHFVGRRMKALEARLGRRLFVRSRPRVRLTEAGRAAARRAEQIGAIWEEMEFGLDTVWSEAGDVRIAAPEGLAGWMLAPFADLFSCGHARLVFTRGDAPAEIALSFRPSPRARRIARIEYGVFAAPETEGQTPFGPFWIEQGPRGSDFREWLEDAPTGAGWAPAFAEDEGATLALIREGAGRGWLPVWLAKREGGLVRRDRELTRRRDLWLEVSRAGGKLERVRRAAEWAEMCARAVGDRAPGGTAPAR